MKFIGNIIWLLFGGIELCLAYVAAGVAYCLTIVGIPLGIQLFKLARLALWPFGASITTGDCRGGCLTVALNIVWIFLGGIEMALAHALLGAVLCITIVGIPFGRQHFKMAAMALTPFGKTVE